MRATLDPHAALCEAQRTRAARGLKIPAELWRTSACASWPGTTTRLEVSLVFCLRLAASKPRDRRAETAIAVTIATSARWRRTSSRCVSSCIHRTPVADAHELAMLGARLGTTLGPLIAAPLLAYYGWTPSPDRYALGGYTAVNLVGAVYVCCSGLFLCCVRAR